jgi:hypothetical protein
MHELQGADTCTSNVMDTNEHASSHQERGVPEGCGNRHKLTGIRSLKTPGPGAVAHMSLHQKPTMSKSHSTKEADNECSPIYGRGTCCPFYVGDRATGTGEKPRQRRVGEGHIWAVSDSVNRLFAILFHFLKKACVQAPCLAISTPSLLQLNNPRPRAASCGRRPGSAKPWVW